VLFFRHIPNSQIAKKVGVRADTIAKWSKEPEDNWIEERRQFEKELVESYIGTKKTVLPTILNCGLDLILNSFRDRLSDGNPLSLNEARIVSGVITDLDKIIRLDAGDPTEISEVKRTIPTTMEELKKAIRRDPFIDVIELDKDVDYVSPEDRTDKQND